MNVDILLFDDFETLDAFIPAQIFGMAGEYFHVNYVSVFGGIINSTQGAKIWTEILEPENVNGILIIPGGRGAKKVISLEQDTLTEIKKAVTSSELCLMASSGSALVSQTGLLYHREIADYSGDENWKRMFSAGIRRTPGIRWLTDGKFYSCSTSMYAMDMSLGVVEDTVDIDVALRIAKKLGYEWDPESREALL